MSKRLVAAVVVIAIGVYASYVRYEPARSRGTLCDLSEEAGCDDSVLIRRHIGKRQLDLGIIEFDDEGQLRDRDLAEAVIAHAKALAVANPTTVVVFAHGWNHNAMPADGNLASFVNLLAELDCAEVEFVAQEVPGAPVDRTKACGAESQQRTTMGVYLGWHGKSWRGPLHLASFWARKATAERIGERGASEVLYRLSAVRDAGFGARANRLVIAGHSFGGALVFSATSHALSASIETLAAGNRSRFADVVIVINAAFEAQRAESLYRRALEMQDQLTDADPLFVAVTATNDFATGWAFPIGRWFTTLLRHYESQPSKYGVQSRADRTALGHYVPYRTHRLSAAPPAARHLDGWIAAASCWYTGRGAAGWRIRFPTVFIEQIRDDREEWAARPTRGPFLNIVADPEVVDDHNGIWESSLRLFLRDLVAVSFAAGDLRSTPCGAPSPSSERRRGQEGER